MSTFNGIITEFPEIRGKSRLAVSLDALYLVLTSLTVDFFRRRPGDEPPLACFLSHVHSDHLVGLETLRSPL